MCSRRRACDRDVWTAKRCLFLSRGRQPVRDLLVTPPLGRPHRDTAGSWAECRARRWSWPEAAPPSLALRARNFERATSLFTTTIYRSSPARYRCRAIQRLKSRGQQRSYSLLEQLGLHDRGTRAGGPLGDSRRSPRRRSPPAGRSAVHGPQRGDDLAGHAARSEPARGTSGDATLGPPLRTSVTMAVARPSRSAVTSIAASPRRLRDFRVSSPHVREPWSVAANLGPPSRAVPEGPRGVRVSHASRVDASGQSGPFSLPPTPVTKPAGRPDLMEVTTPTRTFPNIAAPLIAVDEWIGSRSSPVSRFRLEGPAPRSTKPSPSPTLPARGQNGDPDDAAR